MNVYMFSHRTVGVFNASVIAADETQAWVELESYLDKIAIQHDVEFDMDEFYLRSTRPHVVQKG